MILLQFIFLLYWKLLCNSTELLQNKGFIISSEEPSSVIFSHVVTQYSQCILCLLLVFDIFQIMTVVKKKKEKEVTRHFWCSVYESFSINIFQTDNAFFSLARTSRSGAGFFWV